VERRIVEDYAPKPRSTIDSFPGGSGISDVRYETNHAPLLKSGAI
jgi:hypothetical protein